MSGGIIRLQHYAWGGVNSSNSIFEITITFVPERYGIKFIDGSPDLYFQPVAFFYIETATDGLLLKLPAIPIQQQNVWYTQPIDDGFSRSARADLRLEPGVQGNFVERRQ